MKKFKLVRSILLFITSLNLMVWHPPLMAQDPVDLKTVTLLGIQPVNFDIPKIHQHLYDIGGFVQARSTVRQQNIDKFFPRSRIRDSYYLEVRYNNTGKVTSMKRLYRPYSTENTNQRLAIQTKDIALKLIPQAGQPTRVVRKGWGGTLTYPRYEWEDDNIKIVIDREGSEKLGNVFVEYQVKNESPYAIAQKN